MLHQVRRFSLVAGVALAAMLTVQVAQATPPAHAPAHGWRAKHDPNYHGYKGYTGREWERDYGISGGRCNRDEVGTVVGAVIGGAIGSTVAKGDSRIIAILAGATIGAIVGREIGRDMNDSDRACMGHALEIGTSGQRIAWNGANPGLEYTMTLGDGFERDGQSCRRFTIERELDGRNARERAAACRTGEGQWRLVSS